MIVGRGHWRWIGALACLAALSTVLPTEAKATATSDMQAVIGFMNNGSNIGGLSPVRSGLVSPIVGDDTNSSCGLCHTGSSLLAALQGTNTTFGNAVQSASGNNANPLTAFTIAGLSVSFAPTPAALGPFTTANGTPRPVPVGLAQGSTDPLAFYTTGVPLTAVVVSATGGTAAAVGTTVTFTPTVTNAPGSFTYTLYNQVANATINRTVIINIGATGPPNPTAQSLATGFNQAISVDLTTGATNAAASAALVGTPVGGTVTGFPATTVTFTPTPGFTGNASFQFTTTNGFGPSPTTTVAIAVATPPPPSRLSPDRDPSVSALVSEQIQTTQRMAKMQLDHFSRRLEELRNGATGLQVADLSFGVGGRSASVGSLSRLLDGSAAAAPDRSFASGDLSNAQLVRLAALSDRGVAGDRPVALSTGNPGGVGFDRGDGYPTTDRPKQTAQGDARTPPRSFAGVALPPGVGVFVNGEVGLGTQSGSPRLSSFEYYMVSLSTGLDYRFNDNVVLGIGAGLSNSSSNIVGGSTASGEEYNVALYGVWIPIKRFYLESVVEIGSISLDSKRVSPVPNVGTALGNRSGRDFSASLTAGYDFVSGAWVLNPYLRVNSISISLDPFAESGAGNANLAFGQQSADALEGVAAFRLAYRWQTANGNLIVPYLRAEYTHNYNGGHQSALVNFVTAPALTPFVVPAIGLHNDMITFGAGVQANLQRGLSLQAAYQTLVGAADQSDHRFLVGLSQRF